jgi:multiple sugar transport system permease protein
MAERLDRALPRARARGRATDAVGSAATALRWGATYLVLTAVGLLMILPLLWMVTASFKVGPEIAARPIVWFPRQLYLGAYADLATNVALVRVFWNSMFVTLAITLGILATSSLTGYALAKIQFPGRDAFFVFTLSTMMVPFFVLVIPVYYLTKLAGWLDTYEGLIVPNMVSAFGIFLMRQYMLTIPEELLDAARIDGAGELGIFRKIALPLTVPALSALGVFTFMFHWDSFLWPLLIVHRPEMRTIPVALSSLQTFAGAIENMNIIMAGTTLAVLPVLLVFLVAQRQFIEGITLSGLKG